MKIKPLNKKARKYKRTAAFMSKFEIEIPKKVGRLSQLGKRNRKNKRIFPKSELYLAAKEKGEFDGRID